MSLYLQDSQLLIKNILIPEKDKSSHLNQTDSKIQTFLSNKLDISDLSSKPENLVKVQWDEKEIISFFISLSNTFSKESLINLEHLTHLLLKDKSKSELELIKKEIFENLGEKNPVSQFIEFEINATLYGNKTANLRKLESVGDVPAFIGISHEDIQSYFDKHLSSIADLWDEFLDKQQSNKKGLTQEATEVLKQIETLIEEHFKENNFPSKDLENFSQAFSNCLLMVRSTGREDSDLQANPGGNESVSAVKPELNQLSSAIGKVIASYYSPKSMEQRLDGGDDISANPFTPVLIQLMVGETLGGETDESMIPLAGVLYTEETEGETPGLTRIDVAFGHNEAIVNGLTPFDTFYVGKKGRTHHYIRNKDERIVPTLKKNQSSDHISTKLTRKEIPASLQKQNTLPANLQARLKDLSNSIHDLYGKPMDVEWIYSPKEDKIFLVQARPIVKKEGDILPSIVRTDMLREATTYKGKTIVAAGGNTRIVTHPEEILVFNTVNEALDVYLHKLDDKSVVKAVICKKPTPATSHEAGLFRQAGIVILQVEDLTPLKNWSDQGQYLLIDTQQELLIIDKKNEEMENLDSKEIEKKLFTEGSVVNGWYKHPISSQESIPSLTLNERTVNTLWSLLKTDHPEIVESLEKKSIQDLLKIISKNKEKEYSNHALTALLRRLYHKTVKSQKSEQGAKVVNLFKHILLISNDITQSDNPMARLHALKRLETAIYQPHDPEMVGTDSLVQVLKEEKAAKNVRDRFDSKEFSHPIDENEAKSFDEWAKPFLNVKAKADITSNERESYLVQYRKMDGRILNPIALKNWQIFSTSIALNGSGIANTLLSQSLIKLFENDVADFFICQEFYSIEETNPLKILESLTEEIKQLEPTFDFIKSSNKILVSWQKKIEKFEHIKEYPKLWKKFEKEFIPLLLDENLYARLNDRSISKKEKQIILLFLSKGTDIYDLCIKTMKNSPEYKTADQKILVAQQFIQMIKPYKELMFKTTELVSLEIVSLRREVEFLGIQALKADNVIPTYNESLNTRINLLESIIETLIKVKTSREESLRKSVGGRYLFGRRAPIKPYPDDETLGIIEDIFLNPTENFVVSAERLALPVNYYRQNVGTLDYFTSCEDLFSLIHQNTLTSLNMKFSQSIDMKALKPVFIEKINNFIKLLEKTVKANYKKDSPEISCRISNVQYEFPNYVLEYQIPLRNHSAAIQISYDFEKKVGTVKNTIYSWHDTKRILERSIRESGAKNIDFEDTVISDQKKRMFEFTWNFDTTKANSDQTLHDIVEMILHNIYMTF